MMSLVDGGLWRGASKTNGRIAALPERSNHKAEGLACLSIIQGTAMHSSHACLPASASLTL